MSFNLENSDFEILWEKRELISFFMKFIVSLPTTILFQIHQKENTLSIQKTKMDNLLWRFNFSFFQRKTAHALLSDASKRIATKWDSFEILNSICIITICRLDYLEYYLNVITQYKKYINIWKLVLIVYVKEMSIKLSWIHNSPQRVLLYVKVNANYGIIVKR